MWYGRESWRIWVTQEGRLESVPLCLFRGHASTPPVHPYSDFRSCVYQSSVIPEYVLYRRAILFRTRHIAKTACCRPKTDLLCMTPILGHAAYSPYGSTSKINPTKKQEKSGFFKQFYWPWSTLPTRVTQRSLNEESRFNLFLPMYHYLFVQHCWL